MLRVQKINYNIEQGSGAGDVCLTRTSRAGVVTLWPKLFDTQAPCTDVCNIGPSRPDAVQGSMLDEVRQSPERQIAKPWSIAVTAKNFLLNMGFTAAALIIVPGFGTAAALKWGAVIGAAVALPFARTQAKHLRKDDGMLGFCKSAEDLRELIVTCADERSAHSMRQVMLHSERVVAMCDIPMKHDYYQYIRRFAAARSIPLAPYISPPYRQGVPVAGPPQMRGVMLPCEVLR